MTTIPPATIAAFHATGYGVEAPDAPFVLRIGEHSPPLAALMAAHAAPGAAYLTAWNPRSTQADPAANARAQDNLRTALAEQAIAFLDGWGADPEGRWPPEHSLLALGLDLPVAAVLADRFGQDAFVWSGPDARPQLILRR